MDQMQNEYSSADENGGSSVSLVGENNYTISPSGSFRCNVASWQKGDFLGRGSFGTVYEGFTDDGFFFAVKEVSLLDQGSQGQESIIQLEQEISILKQFQHENVVRYLGTDRDDAKLYIILELVTKGSLAKLYEKYQLRDSQVSVYTRQILSGLNYLHCRNVVHRFATRLTDIKENSEFKASDTNLKDLIHHIKENYGLKYVYMWHALAGYWGGVQSSSETLKKYNPKLQYPVQSPGKLGNIRDIAMDSLEKYRVGMIDPKKNYDFYNDMEYEIWNMFCEFSCIS
ncbi:hypothetical protein ACS0TY_028433 [Phlomoides rotata]